MQRIIIIIRIFATIFCFVSLGFCVYEYGCLYVKFTLWIDWLICYSFPLHLFFLTAPDSDSAVRYVTIFRFIRFALKIGHLKRMFWSLFSKISFSWEENMRICYFFALLTWVILTATADAWMMFTNQFSKIKMFLKKVVEKLQLIEFMKNWILFVIFLLLFKEILL